VAQRAASDQERRADLELEESRETYICRQGVDVLVYLDELDPQRPAELSKESGMRQVQMSQCAADIEWQERVVTRKRLSIHLTQPKYPEQPSVACPAPYRAIAPRRFPCHGGAR